MRSACRRATDTNEALFTTHYSLLTAHYSPLATHHSPRPQACASLPGGEVALLALPSATQLVATLGTVKAKVPYYSLPTTHYPPLTAHHSLLTTHHSPLTTHHPPLTTH